MAVIKSNRYLTLALLLSFTLLVSAALPNILEASRATPDPGKLLPENVLLAQADPAGSEVEGTETVLSPLSDNPEGTSCTYPIEYWQARSEAWPPQVNISGRVYNRSDIQVFYLNSASDAYTKLLQQVYTAFLNILHGAKIEPIQDTLFESLEWLKDNPNENSLSEFTRRQGVYLAALLENYNKGEIGPGACHVDQNSIAVLPETGGNLPPTEQAPTAAAPTQASVVIPQQAAASQEDRNDPPVTQADLPPLPTIPSTAQPPTATPPTDPPPTSPHPTSPPPTSPPPPESQASNSCISSNKQEGQKLADQYGVSYEEIMGWFCQGFGFGEIDKAYELSRETGTSVSVIMDMRRSGLGWGEIKKKL